MEFFSKFESLAFTLIKIFYLNKYIESLIIFMMIDRYLLALQSVITIIFFLLLFIDEKKI